MTKTVGVVGLGYVGLPLAIEFGKSYPTIGYDLSRSKIDSYRASRDPTGEVTEEQFHASRYLKFSTEPQLLRQADVVIVAVPTPIDSAHRLGPIASTTIAARGSAVRLRSFTPSTSKSSDPSSFIVYITGTTSGQPVGPTVANRPILCERKNSSSAAVNIFHILDSTIRMATAATSTIGGYTITRREPLDRLEGEYLELCLLYTSDAADE